MNKGPITYDSLYNGETYDARLEQFIQGWNGPGFDDSSWMNATVANPGVGILSSQLFESIRAPKHFVVSDKQCSHVHVGIGVDFVIAGSGVAEYRPKFLKV